MLHNPHSYKSRTVCCTHDQINAIISLLLLLLLLSLFFFFFLPVLNMWRYKRWDAALCPLYSATVFCFSSMMTVTDGGFKSKSYSSNSNAVQNTKGQILDQQSIFSRFVLILKTHCYSESFLLFQTTFINHKSYFSFIKYIIIIIIISH